MPLPVVAIVGRPNVGKSSLFNFLAGRRISIVDPTAGVTRDRVSTVVQAGDRYFELVDTGGMGIQDVDNLTADVERQIQHAIDSAAVIMFVADVRDGVAPLDREVADRVRTLRKPVVFVANKADTEKLSHSAGELNALGFGEPLCVSADQKLGKPELLGAVLDKLPPEGGDEAPPGEVALKLAIVGRRNVGKSTFINSLADSDRVIVSEVPGTTRDSIDVRFERDGKSFLAIDTAGVKKTRSLATDIEYYSMHRAERSIRRADVVLHFFDPRHRVGRVDKQLAEYIRDHHKPAVFVVNKWDLLKTVMPTERMGNYIRSVFPMLEYVPVAFVTATKGKNVLRLLQLAMQLHKQSGERVGTGDLNRVIRAAVDANGPPAMGNRIPKIYYATQIGTHPPTIVLFTNGPELFTDTYLRYLQKVLRDSFPFSEVAVKLVLRAKGEGGGPVVMPAAPAGYELVDEATEEMPVVRKPAPLAGGTRPRPIQAQLVEDTPAEPPRAKKRKKTSTEAWDF